MGSGLANRVWKAMCANGGVRPGSRIGVAVSGGADSVALLLLLQELSKQKGLVLCVLHLNHALRGKVSEQDEKFVATLARRLGCEFFSRRVAVSQIAKKQKQNLEDTARRVRYEWFEQMASEHQLACVATAHTADDQAETVLGHMLRGAGLAGWSGIHPKRGVIIRPLLSVRRKELRAYLKTRGQRWREDTTNRDVTRTRARIRKKLLPLLEKEFQPRVVEHLAELAQHALEHQELISELMHDARRRFVSQTECGLRIAARDLLAPLPSLPQMQAGALSNMLTLALAAEAKPAPAQLTAVHIESIRELAERGENGKSLELPGGLRVRREHDFLFFGSPDSFQAPTDYEHPIEAFDVCCSVQVPQLQCVFRFRVIDWPSDWRDTSLTGTVLDRDRLSFPLALRNWWPGDQMHPVGRQRSHKLKHLLSELRLSKWERNGWPVLVSAGELAWVRGLPVGIGFAANERTKTGIVIAVEPALKAGAVAQDMSHSR